MDSLICYRLLEGGACSSRPRCFGPVGCPHRRSDPPQSSERLHSDPRDAPLNIGTFLEIPERSKGYGSSRAEVDILKWGREGWVCRLLLVSFPAWEIVRLYGTFSSALCRPALCHFQIILFSVALNLRERTWKTMTDNAHSCVFIFHDLENLAQNSGVDSMDLHFQESPWKMTFICIYNYLAPVEAQIMKTHYFVIYIIPTTSWDTVFTSLH